MSKSAIKKKILDSLGCLLRFDHYLLENDINERSISHKLAEYLGYEFPNYNVDCEYNKMLKDPKIIHAFENLAREMVSSEEANNEEIGQIDRHEQETGEIIYDYAARNIVEGRRFVVRRIYPDIIVHHRGSSENLLVIEIKKSTNVSKSQRNWDEMKLKRMTTAPFNYKYGATVEIPCKLDLQKHIKFQTAQLTGYNIFEIK